MYSLLKSDFYKLVHTKSFYICGILSAVFSSLSILAYNFLILAGYGITDVSMLGLNAVDGLKQGIFGFGEAVTILVTIVTALFTACDFSHGTIKNILSAGVSRYKVYASKLIITLAVTVIFVILGAVSSFTTGAILWEVGDLTRDLYLEMLQIIGMAILIEFSSACLYVMLGFMIKKTGVTVSIALLLNQIIVPLACAFASMGIKNWFKLEEFDLLKYWPLTYARQITQIAEMEQQDIITAVIVCVSYVVVTTVLGMIVFKKRDIQ